METDQILDGNFTSSPVFKDNQGRRKIATQAFYFFLLISLVSLGLDLLEISKDESLISEEFYSEDISTTVLVELGLFLIYFVNYLVCVVTFIRWFRRAYWNLHQAKIANLSHSEGMAAGSWFIPFLNLVYPYNIMKDIWDKMQGYLASTLEDYTVKQSGIVLGWWLLFLINNFLGRIATRTVLRAENVEEYINAIYISIAHGLIQPIAIWAVITIMERTGEIEDLFYKNYNE